MTLAGPSRRVPVICRRSQRDPNVRKKPDGDGMASDVRAVRGGNYWVQAMGNPRRSKACCWIGVGRVRMVKGRSGALAFTTYGWPPPRHIDFRQAAGMIFPYDARPSWRCDGPPARPCRNRTRGQRSSQDRLTLLQEASAQETGNFSGVTRRVGGVAWGGTPRGPGDRAFESWPATDREARH